MISNFCVNFHVLLLPNLYRMIRLCTLFSFIFLLGCIQAQQKTFPNSFIIQKNGLPEKAAFYTACILKSNVEQYRLKDKEVILVFQEGFECLLLSASSIKQKGLNIDITAYLTEHRSLLPVFSILESGHLIAHYTKQYK